MLIEPTLNHFKTLLNQPNYIKQTHKFPRYLGMQHIWTEMFILRKKSEYMIKLGWKMNRIEKIGIGLSEIEIESNRAVRESLQLYSCYMPGNQTF